MVIELEFVTPTIHFPLKLEGLHADIGEVVDANSDGMVIVTDLSLSYMVAFVAAL